MPAYCLNLHARYRCAHSGDCCTAGWPIPAEPALAHVLARRGLGAAWTAERAFEEQPGPDGPMRVLRTKDGHACVFYEDDGRRCGVHRVAGEEVLPSACRNFPRVTLHDSRGLFITLSHFCPTAAALLLEVDAIAIVEAPASLTLNGAVEGLDATGVLPPLLRPGMLADLSGYGAWERAAIAAFDDPVHDVDSALAVIAAATGDICAWRPGAETLGDRVDSAFERAGLRASSPASPPAPLDRPIKAFLAAHLFGSWSAYQDGGLSAVVRAVDRAYEVLRGELRRSSFIPAVRAADFHLRHSRTDVRSRSLSPLRDHRHQVG